MHWRRIACILLFTRHRDTLLQRVSHLAKLSTLPSLPYVHQSTPKRGSGALLSRAATGPCPGQCSGLGDPPNLRIARINASGLGGTTSGGQTSDPVEGSYIIP